MKMKYSEILKRSTVMAITVYLGGSLPVHAQTGDTSAEPIDQIGVSAPEGGSAAANAGIADPAATPEVPIATDAPKPTGVASIWHLYQEIWFGYNNARLEAAEMNKLSEIARYLKENPSIKLAVDNALDSRSTDSRDQELSTRRIQVVHDVLVKAGVPSSTIEVGAFGNSKLARDRRIAVLLLKVEK